MVPIPNCPIPEILIPGVPTPGLHPGRRAVRHNLLFVGDIMTNSKPQGPSWVLPLRHPLMSGLMRKLSTIRQVSHRPPYEMVITIPHSELFMQRPSAGIDTYRELYERLNMLEGRAYLVGDGVDEPEGVFSCGRIQCLSRELSVDSVIQLLQLLAISPKKLHPATNVFLCSDDTATRLSELRSDDHRPIYRKAISVDVPHKLLGYRLYTDPNIPDGQLMFGDIQSGYLIETRADMVVIRDSTAHKPHTLFHLTHRAGGSVVNPEALKILEFNYGDDDDDY